MKRPIEEIFTLKIGTVEKVTTSDIIVELDLDSPDATALNTGVPQGFPKINYFVLIPNEIGALVGIITKVFKEYAEFPKRKEADFNLVDLPFPKRQILISPVGTLKYESKMMREVITNLRGG